MKLIDKYNRLNIAATIATFVIGSCIFYFLISYVLVRELDERLLAEQQEIQAYINAHNALPDIVQTKNLVTTYQPGTPDIKTEFFTRRDWRKDDDDNVREIRFGIHTREKYYLVVAATPLEETEALLQVIIGVTVFMVGIILLIGFLINRIVVRRLWKPFYETINKVKSYHLDDHSTLKFNATDIDEFSLLNQSINEMVERIQQDYISLKDFTSQAAHEMLTPLAIIRSRLDLLMQNESVLEKNGRYITDIENGVHRLARLHQSLLLLTRVENRQFVLHDEVQLHSLVTDKYTEYSEMADAMNLDIQLSLRPATILCHQQLAEIMVSNLLNNAIRYNRAGGNIDITLRDNRLSIANTSVNGALDQQRLFKRFYRGQTALEGNGLGLSIVKQICDMAGYAIDYRYMDEMHHFIIDFNK